MNLKPDGIWEVVGGCDTFENYCNTMVPEFNIHNKVPEPIANRLRVIEKLITHSYFEYGFIDVALIQLFTTLEFALHLKFKEMYPNKSDKKNLKPYLDWAFDEKVINVSSAQKKFLNELRNHVAHLKTDTVLGITSIKMIKTVGNDIICKLF